MAGHADSLIKINQAAQMLFCVAQGGFRVFHPFPHPSHLETAIFVLKSVKLFSQFRIGSFCFHQFQHGENAAKERLIGFLCQAFLIKYTGAIVKFRAHSFQGMADRQNGVSM